MRIVTDSEIGELTLEGIAYSPNDPRRHNKRKRILLRIVGALLAVVLAVAASGACWWMWQHHWRRVSVNVDGTTVSERIDSTVQNLLDQNNNFGHTKGKLLAVDGSVLTEDGGKDIVVKVNGGEALTSDQLKTTTIPENGTINITNGEDVTEEYDVTSTAVAHGIQVNTGGSIQRVKTIGKDGKKETWTGKQSKITVDKGVTEQPQDTVIEAISPRPKGKKVIALTFDDGPSQYSTPILDILKKKGVKATFFDLGTEAAALPDVEKRMVNEGHQVASHSNSHPNMAKMSRNDLRNELKDGFANIKSASGTDTKVFRSPYGSFTKQQWEDAYDLIDCNVLWDIDTLDWELPGATAIHDAVLDNAYNGAIVLMHDGGGNRSQDVSALPSIIDDLKKQGYSFVTIDELMNM